MESIVYENGVPPLETVIGGGYDADEETSKLDDLRRNVDELMGAHDESAKNGGGKGIYARIPENIFGEKQMELKPEEIEAVKFAFGVQDPTPPIEPRQGGEEYDLNDFIE